MFYTERDILFSQWKMAIERSLGWDLLTDTKGKYNYKVQID